MPASQLKRLKESLKASGVTGQPSKPKKSKNQKQDARTKRDREEALQNIRQQFNPFDKKVNRQKEDVLGRNVTGTVGNPALAKQQGEEARRAAYDMEKKRKNKTGGVKDRRLGENDPTMTAEEKMLARFTKERQRASKSSMFDLDADDADFNGTVYGKSLAFQDEDTGFADDEDILVPKRQRSVEEEEKEKVDEEQPAPKKSKKEVMEEVIAKSKKHKLERQRAKEDYLEQVEELDDQNIMNELMMEMNGASNNNNDDEDEDGYDASYDVKVRELGLDKRAAPSDRTKTEEELEKEKQEKLKKREAERQARMMGEDVDYESIDEDEEEKKKGREDDGDEGATAAHEFGLEIPLKKKDKGGEEDEEDDGEEDGNFDDILGDSDDFEEGDEEEGEEEEEEDKTKKPKKTNVEPKGTCPSTVKEILELVSDNDFDKQINIIRSTLDKYHPRKAFGNKEKQGEFMIALVEYLRYLVQQETEIGNKHFESFIKIIKRLSKDHYDHATLAKHFRQELQEISEGMQSRLEGSNYNLTSSHLLLFALIGALFSSSDHYHQVCAPACILIGQHLSQCSVRTIADIAVNTFLVSVLLSYQRIAERYMPEIPLFLTQAVIILTGTKQTIVTKDIYVPKISGININLEKLPEFKPIKLQSLTSTASNKLAPQLLVQNLYSIEQCAKLWRSKTAFIEIFKPIITILSQSTSCKQISDIIAKLGKFTKFAKDERRPLTLQAHRAVPLASLTPKFEENYNLDVKSYDDDSTRKEVKKLQKEMKDEKKAALKELRRDSKFNARQQIQEKKAEYEKYHKDMAKLYDTIQTEEGAEKNKYEREKEANKRAAKRSR